jgi:hypothetical protein
MQNGWLRKGFTFISVRAPRIDSLLADRTESVTEVTKWNLPALKHLLCRNALQTAINDVPGFIWLVFSPDLWFV